MEMSVSESPLSQVRYGIIGCGMMGQEHLRNIALLPGARVSRIFEPDEDMARKSRTTLRLDSLQYNVPLNENQFTVQALDARHGFVHRLVGQHWFAGNFVPLHAA